MFSPKTRLLYIPANENLCATLNPQPATYQPGQIYTGVELTIGSETIDFVLHPDAKDHIGEIQAWDPSTGKKVWTQKFKDQIWTWGEFADAIERTARVLAGRGVKKGDRVAIMATNTYAHVMLMFALARIRAIMVPVNPEFGVEEAKYVMSHAGVSTVACSTDTLQIAKQAAAEIKPAPWFMMVDEAAEGLPLLTELIKNPGDAKLPDDVSSDDSFAISYSSGTTGFPKGALQPTHGRYVSAVAAQHDFRFPIERQQQLRFPGVEHAGTHRIDVADRQHEEHFQPLHRLHDGGEMLDGRRIGQIAALREAGHGQMLFDQPGDGFGFAGRKAKPRT